MENLGNIALDLVVEEEHWLVEVVEEVGEPAVFPLHNLVLDQVGSFGADSFCGLSGFNF